MEIPDYFKEKWDKRIQNILNSNDCPRKDNGEPDWSVIEFRAAKRCFYGYRFRSSDKRKEVMGWIEKLVADLAQRRNKTDPLKYAAITVQKAAGQVMEEGPYAGISNPATVIAYWEENNRQRQKRWEETWER